MKKVKLSFPPNKWNIEKHSPSGSCIWGDYEFFLNQEIDECDFWLVCGNIVPEYEKTIVPKKNVIFETSESADIVNYTQKFLSQFSYASSFRTDLKHINLLSSIPIIPWFVKMNFDELSQVQNVPKTKQMSLLASDKKISVNHLKRLNFVKKIHKYFGNEIDIYGAGFTKHVYDKNSTLDPYKYSIILETIEVPEYFSEKLGDCLLSQTFPIYHGCSNLDHYFKPKSYQRIHMQDFEASVKSIKEILNSDNFYEEKIEFLLDAKKQYLDNYSMFSVMASILDKVRQLNGSQTDKKELVKITKFDPSNVFDRITNRLKVEAYDLFHKP
ncbi:MULTISPECIES: glycosyltransferase family 10 domain-containing protein [Flavobacterium]|jgi:hypothetical protein|uniref:Glycosyltransferase family 10 n=1 Tax=Flavobacterium algoritolerans TaxID=3041254 RepID=A0ABT6VBL2_9FLAO|nr:MULTISPECIES: glycosyltransferase family 10 [Flavobacterium]MDI5887455.1 glycosyltransferase family 10 [Flavobacterium yafengii]MDI5895621.1 glycosyltransferase family 10 [Flavobacterium algoritolerans]